MSPTSISHPPGPLTISRPNLSSSHGFLWFSLLLFAILVVAFLLPVTPQDYWWYLPIGKATLQTGSVPSVDTLSFTQAGKPIFYQSWLAAVILWLVYQLGGLTLTFLLRGLVLGIAYCLLWWLMRGVGAGPRLASLITLVAALSASNNWGLRPQLLAYPLFVLTLWVLYSWLRGERKYLWTLAVIALVWCNLHSSYVLFFILITSALLLGKGDRRALLPWVLLCYAAMFVNPRGFRVIPDTLELLRSPSNQVFSAEWHPPVNAGWQMNIFFAWTLCLAPIAVLSKRRLSLLEWSWFVIFGWMALSGTRYVIWFLFLMALFTAAWLAEYGSRFIDRPPTTGSPGLNLTIGAALLLASLSILPGFREGWWPDAPLPYEPETTPIAATAWLSAHPELPGPMLSDYTFSSYLAFALPSRPAWIDTRFFPFPPEQWRRFQALASAEPSWPSILDEEHINLVFLARVTEPRLIDAMRLDPDWCEKYADENAVVFARCDPLP